MQTSFLKAALIIGAVAFAPCVAQADNEPEQKSAAQSGARARLAPPAETGGVERKITKQDFEWAALTGNGPANGAVPVIGAGSGKAYYDFKDGLPHPYYIAPK